ncbi:MAG TPA: peptidase M23 [Sedimenticola sp.]|nr:peptidase M23 [Sedimenticola sp.]
MIRDYKSGAPYGFHSRRHFRPLSLLGLPLALVASGLYAALQYLEPVAPPPQNTAAPSLHTVSLALPESPYDEPATGPSQDAPLIKPAPTASPAASPAPPTPKVAPKSKQPPDRIARIPESDRAPVETSESPAGTAPRPRLNWKEHRIRPGESLATIFPRLGLGAGLLHRIVNSSKTAAGLARIKPGETLLAALDGEGNLQELILRHSAIRSLRILPDGDSFKAQMMERELEPRITHTTGTVKNSLFISARRTGLSDRLIMELANIFGWDIDFALEIRAGDRFSVVYQQDFLDGEKYRDGPILAAEFVNRGRVFRAVRYVDETGRADYFSPDGKSVRKAFLRSPVDFRRISSHFQKSRWHPVLGKKRPHRGVDYAAAPGTPVKASGDGRIIHRARKGGYGRAVIIEHGGGITTLYGHLSRYAPKQRRGTRVRQGDIIGYVGQSGLASGPHLHYEFRINGVHRNPLTVKLPAANPIARKYRADFLRKAAPLLARLDALGKTMVADAN